MALVMEPPKTKKKVIVLSQDKKQGFEWNFKEQKKSKIDPDKLMGISMFNKDLELITNKDKIIYPEETDSKTESDVKTGSEEFQEPEINPAEDEQSIIIDKLRDLVVRFEKLMEKYLDPDLPTGRKARRKYMQERELFANVGYKEFIRTIQRKVHALCKYEDEFNMEMFEAEEDEGWFNETCDEALNGDFLKAQEIINSVEQIVVEDTLATPQKRIITKIR